MNSGTSALHVALRLLGVGPGDEVLCSSFSFVASAGPITYLGAIPVFVDCESFTWNMCPQALQEAITHRLQAGVRPKALILAHCYGMPGFVSELLEVAHRYGIPVVEDAAEALGSSWNGQSLGTLGDFGVYSFNGNKICTASAGGALVCASEEWAQRAKWLISQCKDPVPHFEHREVGYNYGMSNLLAAVAVAELEELSEKVQKRREVFDQYYEELSALLPEEHFDFQAEPDGGWGNRWLSALYLEPESRIQAESLRQKLLERQIETRPLWKPLHQQRAFSGTLFFGSGLCETLFQGGICLPSGQGAPIALGPL